MRPIQFHQLAFYLIAALILWSFTVQAAPRALQASVQIPENGLRQALVIANGDYQVGKLNNPVNDGRLIADALRQTGFKVTLLENAKRQSMLNAIARFGEQIEQGGTGLVYYAGHGMQVNGENWLIPVDANIKREEDVLNYGVNTQALLDRMAAAKNPLNLVLLDACRNNPYARKTRSLSGLARMDAGAGMLLAFSTAPGQSAEDGVVNSPFATALAQYMVTPGLSIEHVLKRVRSEVKRLTLGKQTTWESSSLEVDFYFIPSNQLATQQPVLPPSATPPPIVLDVPAPADMAKQAFPNYQGSVSIDDLLRRNIIAQRHKALATRWIESLKIKLEYEKKWFLSEMARIEQGSKHDLEGMSKTDAVEQREMVNRKMQKFSGEMEKLKTELARRTKAVGAEFEAYGAELQTLISQKKLDEAEQRLKQAEYQMQQLEKSLRL
jgi:hypothetical protein